MRVGRQEPTYSVVGTYAYSDGKEVAEMFEAEGGATFYDSQLHELELMLARNEDGSPAGATIAISKPRQNGKSYAARYYAAYMADFEHRNVLYSAHNRKTSKKMFDELCELFESPNRFPEFSADIDHISHSIGYEGIYFKDWQDKNGIWHKGGCIDFTTRTNGGARGGTYSVIVVDEAQEMTSEQQEALLPVLSASGSVDDVSMRPQQIYIGTPTPPTSQGTVFTKMHTVAHEEGPKEIWWLEWSVEADSVDKIDFSKENALELAYQTNPAMGYRMAESTILNELEQMQPDGFARERLGWWSPTVSAVNFALDSDKWDMCRSKEKKPEGKTAYGVKFSADGSEVLLAGAVISANGTARISQIERKSTASGTRWLADWLNQRAGKASCVVVDGKNGTDLLCDRISETWKAKGSIIRPSAKDVIASTSLLLEYINEKKLTWFELQEDLDNSARTSTRRPIGGGFGFGGENPLPIEACSLALWGVVNSKRDPNRKQRIG